MKSLQSRLERLESQFHGKDKEADLYDLDGNHVNARVRRWPTGTSSGLAVLDDGSRREIVADIKLIDILRESRRRKEPGDLPEPMSDEDRQALKEKAAEMLYIRVPSISQRILLGIYYKGGGV